MDKLAKNIAKKSYFSRPKGQQEAFVINHYAGPVGSKDNPALRPLLLTRFHFNLSMDE